MVEVVNRCTEVVLFSMSEGLFGVLSEVGHMFFILVVAVVASVHVRVIVVSVKSSMVLGAIIEVMCVIVLVMTVIVTMAMLVLSHGMMVEIVMVEIVVTQVMVVSIQALNVVIIVVIIVVFSVVVLLCLNIMHFGVMMVIRNVSNLRKVGSVVIAVTIMRVITMRNSVCIVVAIAHTNKRVRRMMRAKVHRLVNRVMLAVMGNWVMNAMSVVVDSLVMRGSMVRSSVMRSGLRGSLGLCFSRLFSISLRSRGSFSVSVLLVMSIAVVKIMGMVRGVIGIIVMVVSRAWSLIVRMGQSVLSVRMVIILMMIPSTVISLSRDIDSDKGSNSETTHLFFQTKLLLL